MSESSVKPSHFWVGTFLTLGAVIVNIWQTNSQIRAQRYENQLTQISVVLKDLSSAIGELSFQLESQASMYVEMQGCLTKTPNEIKQCWKVNESFDPAASSQAWRKMDSLLAYSDPYLVSTEEIDLLNKLRALKTFHQQRIREIIPPESASNAESASDVVLKTRESLETIQDQLVLALAERVRGNN